MRRTTLAALLVAVGASAAAAAEGDAWWLSRMDSDERRHEPRRYVRAAPRPSPEVMAAQLRLQDAGYDVEPDGFMGPKTRDALRRFQWHHDLPTTGELDKATRDALRDTGDDNNEDDAATCRAAVVRSGDGVWREAQLCVGEGDGQ